MARVTTTMLWEMWRITRQRLLTRVSVVATASTLWLAIIDNPLPEKVDGATVWAVIFSWFIVWTLTGSNNEARGWGYPFHSGFIRPVPTAILVMVPMVYLGLVSVAAFIVHMSAMALVIGLPVSLLPCAAIVAGGTLVIVAMVWWSDKASHQLIGWMVLVAVLIGINAIGAENFAPVSAGWSSTISMSIAGYAEIVLMAGAAVTLAVFGVNRQRHRVDAAPRRADSLFAFAQVGEWVTIPCPTSSPARAELWRTAKWHVAPSVIGAFSVALLAVIIRSLSPTSEPKFTLALVLLILIMMVAHRAFGLHFGPGRGSLSVFDSTRPMRTANLAGLRLASAVFGVLLAAVAIALVSLAVGVSVSDDFHVANLSLLRSAAELSMPQLLYWGAFTLVQIFATAACVAALSVSFALCPRATIAGIAPLALFMTFLLVMTLYSDVKVPALAAEHLLLGMLSVILIGATVVLIPVVLRQGILTRREAAWSLVAWAAYGSVYFLPLDYRSLLDPAVSPALVATWLFAGSLFPLAGMMMSTWSLHLIRHR